MAHRKRVLQLYYEPTYSGITRHVLQLLHGLDRNKYDLWVLCSTGDKRIQSSLENAVGRDRVAIVPGARFFSLAGIFGGTLSKRQERVDILHIHNLQSVVWGCLRGLLSDCDRVVFTPQVVNMRPPAAEKVIHQLLKVLGPFTSCTIAVSEEQRHFLLEKGICTESKVITICNRVAPENVPLSMNRLRVRTLHQLPSDAVVVCQVGRLVPQKDPEFLLRVASLTKVTVPDLIYLIVGEGPMAEGLRKRIQAHGLGLTVKMLGFRDDVLDLIHASDVITCTSQWEGLPYSLLEAIMLKKPIVARKFLGVGDLVHDGITGHVVSTEEEFAGRLAALASSLSLREEMGKAAYELNRGLFDTGHMIEEIEMVYDTKAS